MRRRRRRKQRKIIIISSLTLLFIMTIGYAAFQTNINITAKGNILEKGITINDLKKLTVTSGDGLYKDTIEEGRYIYKGSMPNNYITFNNETWRIMSVENDGTLKIIRNESIGKMAWDEKGTRDSSTSTYCNNTNSGVCNAWAATTNLVNKPSVFTLHYPNGNASIDKTTYSGTVTKDASINTYLNGEYYNNLGEDKGYIVSHNFNVGTPGNHQDTENIAIDVQQESIYKWNGEVGLMTITEFLRTTTDTGCINLSIGHNNYSKSVCSNNNWMFNSTYEWTISPCVNSERHLVWNVNSVNGQVGGSSLTSISGIRPSVYLNSNISLKGEGTKDRPFKIQN